MTSILEDIGGFFDPLVSGLVNSYVAKPVYNQAGKLVGNFYDSPFAPDLFRQACQGNLTYLASATQADIGTFSDLLTTDSSGAWIPICSYCHSRGIACLEVVRAGGSSDGYTSVMVTLPDGTQVPSGNVVPNGAAAAPKTPWFLVAGMAAAAVILVLGRGK